MLNHSSGLPAIPVGDALTFLPSIGQSSVPCDPLGFEVVCLPGLYVLQAWFIS